ncbi:hypothetical protein T260_05000 [Geobacillus thermopakistaniensis]|uniref:Uncharacterized protein n=1 Tax=Geobacillus thermopakistaniensis (strain MAS1) TaxID=1408282 RepID=A0A7U9JCT6_GEOTM|nr:hypothetical protein T260_05000 [Geobacillus sp. MAS1]
MLDAHLQGGKLFFHRKRLPLVLVFSADDGERNKRLAAVCQANRLEQEQKPIVGIVDAANINGIQRLFRRPEPLKRLLLPTRRQIDHRAADRDICSHFEARQKDDIAVPLVKPFFPTVHHLHGRFFPTAERIQIRKLPIDVAVKDADRNVAGFQVAENVPVDERTLRPVSWVSEPKRNRLVFHIAKPDIIELALAAELLKLLLPLG